MMLLNCGAWEVPWTVRSNQSILKEISPKYSLEGLMLKLKLQYFGHLMWRADSLGKSLMLGKKEGRRRRGRQWMRWLDGITDSMDMSLSKLDSEGQGGLVCCSPWGHKESDMPDQLNNNNQQYVTVPHAGNRMMNKQLFLILMVQKLVKETRM